MTADETAEGTRSAVDAPEAADPSDDHEVDGVVESEDAEAEFEAKSEADSEVGPEADVAAAAPKRRAPRWLVPVSLVVLLLVSVGLSGWAYWKLYRVDQQTDEAVTTTVIQAASDGTIALLSYKPDSLDADFANAKTHLTGDFLNYYTDFTQKIVTPAAKQKSVSTSAVVVRSAVSQLQPASAEVLLFLNQSTTSKENPDGSFTASSVKVSLTKTDGTWLISAFDPV